MKVCEPTMFKTMRRTNRSLQALTNWHSGNGPLLQKRQVRSEIKVRVSCVSLTPALQLKCHSIDLTQLCHVRRKKITWQSQTNRSGLRSISRELHIFNLISIRWPLAVVVTDWIQGDCFQNWNVWQSRGCYSPFFLLMKDGWFVFTYVPAFQLVFWSSSNIQL